MTVYFVVVHKSSRETALPRRSFVLYLCIQYKPMPHAWCTKQCLVSSVIFIV